LVFKEATTSGEIAQLHQLNHQTFAEELKQYACNEAGFLIDRFHAKNRYFIATEEERVCGMISLNGDAPFPLKDDCPKAFHWRNIF
jgi:N-acyl-L-homoserine lactone synthetase